MPDSVAIVFTTRHVGGRSIARLCFGAGVNLCHDSAPPPPRGRRFRLQPGERFAVLWWERADDVGEQWRTVAVLQARAGEGRPIPNISGGDVKVLAAFGQAGPPGTVGGR